MSYQRLFLFLIYIHFFVSHGLRNKMIRIDRFDVCYTPENPPYILHYFQMHQVEDNQFSISTSAEVLEEMHAKDLSGDIVIIKCSSREFLDSCENFTTLRPPTNICNFIRIKELGMREAMDKFTPPIRCPIQKANYSVKDLRYSLDKFTLFPLGKSYWKVRANGYFKRRLVGTLCFEGQAFDMSGK